MKKYITYKIMQKFDIIDKFKGLTLENNQNNGIYIDRHRISYNSLFISLIFCLFFKTKINIKVIISFFLSSTFQITQYFL
jgi:hypothetical protein